MDILAQALELGLPVFPCADNKMPVRPKTAGGNGYLDATDNPDEIRDLWQHWAGRLIGVPTGAVSGFDAIDVDPRHGGDVWYSDNKHKLPPTRIHRTRSGGLHVLLKHQEGLKSSAGKIAPGIDVRADGGYIVWWPAAGLEFRDYPPSGLSDWPLWLLPSTMSMPVAPPQPYPRKAFEKKSMGKQIEGLIKTVASAPEGERNSITYWAACRASELVAAGQMGAGLAIEIIAEAAVRAGLPKFEAKRTAHSGVTGGRHG